MDDREAKIRARAHQIWEDEGRPHGHEKRHWSQAVDDVDGAPKMSGKTRSKAAPAAETNKLPAAKVGKPGAAAARTPRGAKKI